MKILYLGCHSVLEYDECKLFTELGHYIFSPGSFVEYGNKGDPSLRPQLVIKDEFVERYREDSVMFDKLGKPGINNKELLTLEFVKRFDAVILMHLPLWAHKNWAVIKASGIPFVWRTIGQSVANNEREMKQYREQGMKIVRYSPREKRIPGYIGADAIIRFGKEPDQFGNWNGKEEKIITFAQSMQRREPACNFKYFEEVTRPFPRAIYGNESESLSWGKGKVPYDELLSSLRDNRAYFHTGTWPASYTLSLLESLMTGIPIVAIGPKKGHPHGWFPGHDLYEIGDIIKNGENGFISDSKEELQIAIKSLLNDHELAKKISIEGRKTAIELFGIDTIKAQWKDFLATIS